MSDSDEEAYDSGEEDWAFDDEGRVHYYNEGYCRRKAEEAWEEHQELENGRVKCDACRKFVDHEQLGFTGKHEICPTCAKTYMMNCDGCDKTFPFAQLKQDDDYEDMYNMNFLCEPCWQVAWAKANGMRTNLDAGLEEEGAEERKRDADHRNARAGPAVVKPTAANSAASESAERRATKRAREEPFDEHGSGYCDWW